MNLASNGKKIPLLDLRKGKELLYSLRPSVMDYFSLTSLHFRNLGSEGVVHFVFLLNQIIKNINSDVVELNSVWAVILHKGVGKNVEMEKSFRTISSCPLVAKALDRYLVDLYDDGWCNAQAETQFQGRNSSHELAALCITEAVNHSSTNNDPLYLLLLDAKAAFDKVVIQHAIRCAYH